MAKQLRIALVTGGNKGIGFEVCRELAQKGVEVLLGARDKERGEEAAKKLQAENLPVSFIEVDVSDLSSMRQCVNNLNAQGKHIDILVNNAGILTTGDALAVSMDDLERLWKTNTRGPLFMTQLFSLAMIERKYGRIVNVSSGAGAFSEGMMVDHCAYSHSKTALNSITHLCAKKLPAEVTVNAMCPGWVRTDMGGPNAHRSLEQGADTVVWLALLNDPLFTDEQYKTDQPITGKFFRDRKEIAW